KPEANSMKLGRLQGLVTFANFEELAPIMNLIVVFTSGTYSGSTLSLVGRNSISDQYRQMAIVGGTGVFQMARGCVNLSTYSIDSATEHVVLEYNLYVVYEKFRESSELSNM
ncbi:dirigent 22-like, partial [Olea europaea subsp. europaea]